MKKIAVLPTLLTLGNGICGLVAIAFISKVLSPDVMNDAVTLKDSDSVPKLVLTAIQGFALSVNNERNFAWAGWFILLAMLFDLLDGYVARLSNTASDFGGELDSLCDVISFGVAPAFMLLKLGPGWENPFLHQLLAGIAAIYFACTALRLARFNVENDPDPANHKRFKGLPSPAAAGCIAALAILRGEFATTLNARWSGIDLEAARLSITHTVEIMAPIIALMVSLLMVSNIPYPHLTGKIFRGKKHIGHLIQVLLAAFILLMFRSLAPLLVFWVFAFVFPLRAFFARNAPKEEAPPRESQAPLDEQAPHKL